LEAAADKSFAPPRGRDDEMLAVPHMLEIHVTDSRPPIHAE